MKIQIRRGMFETNSSSVHSLIITNKRDKDKDYEKMKKEEAIWYPEYIYESNCVHTKEDKVLKDFSKMLVNEDFIETREYNTCFNGKKD